MGMHDLGFKFFSPGDDLIELIVLTPNTRESIMEPTDRDFLRVCHEHNLDYDKLMKVVGAKEPDTHTLFIDVEKCREWCGA